MRARRACAGLLLLAICGLARLGQHCAFARTLAAPPEAPFESDAEVLHTADAPIIGVLSQPLGLRAPNTSYFPASYSKYVAMAGARVVPVLCDASTAELHKLYSQINGLVVPGGAQDLRPGNPYYDAMAVMTDLAMQDFDERGEVFPIHYTCLGWEAIAVKVTSNPYILSNFTGALGVPDVLDWQPDAWSAWPLRLVPQAVLQHAETHKIAFEAHHFGVWLPDFWGTELADYFTLLATTADELGKVYVSMVAAKRYPFVAAQFHPEKNAFEWGSPAIPHTLEAVQLAQGIANAFVQMARRSTHRFESDDALHAALLYNYEPMQPAGTRYFDEVYTFPMTAAPDGHKGL